MIEVLAKDTRQNSRIAELEQQLIDLVEEDILIPGQQLYCRGSKFAFNRENSKLKSPSKNQIKQLKAYNVHLDAELVSTKQHLKNREEQIESLKQQLYDAENSVSDRRKSIARRDSIGARQAATLSIQLARAESSLEVMEINYNNLKDELNRVIEEKNDVNKSLNEARALNNARKEDFMFAKDDVLATETYLKEAREEINAQKNIVRRQNMRLQEVETELMLSKKENEHNLFELNKLREKSRLARKTGEINNGGEGGDDEVKQLKKEIQELKEKNSQLQLSVPSSYSTSRNVWGARTSELYHHPPSPKPPSSLPPPLPSSKIAGTPLKSTSPPPSKLPNRNRVSLETW